MFRVIARNVGGFSMQTALCFVDPEEQTDAVIHNKTEGDGGESCAEHKRRVVDKMAINQSWCGSCAHMVVALMNVDGCDDCWDDLPRIKSGLSLYTYTMHNPRWWSLQDDDIQQLQNTPMTFGESGLDHWPTFVDNTDGVGLRNLGFSPCCPVCFMLARCMLSLVQHAGKIRLKHIQITPLLENPWWGADSPNLISLCIDFDWDETRVEGGAVENAKFGILQLALRNLTNEPTLLQYDTNRCNPAFLKHQMEVQFEIYPDKNLQQAAEYPESFRLIDVNQKCVVDIGNQHKRYSAISYRWDDHDNNKLTAESKSFFTTPGSLSPETMSKTLYDCMTMAQLLDIPYIWIDRYCIMQGDKKEKAEQIHAMGDIYANSYLTMICALTLDIHSGLPGYTRNFDGDHEEPGGQCWATTAGIPRSLRGYPDWLERGWTMQEEYLSARRLYFTDSTILWHINCPMVAYHHADSGKTPDCRPTCAVAQKKSPYDLIHEYSDRQLSMPTDRINAISGLLKTRGIEHVFGIPTRSMHYALTWEPGSSGQVFYPDFPSWSWAHWSGEAFWQNIFTKYRPLCRIFHALTPLCKRISFLRQSGLPTTMFTDISDRHLVIRARARRLQPNEHKYVSYDSDHYSLTSTCLVVSINVAWMRTHSLIVEPFCLPGVVHGADVVHARRVGLMSEDSVGIVYPSWGQKLAKLRPLAIQTLTRLKAQCLRNLLLCRKRLVKSMSPRVSGHSRETSKSTEFIPNEGSIGSDQAETKTPPLDHFKATHAVERKRSERSGSSEPRDKHGATLGNIQAGMTKEQKFQHKYTRRKRRKPVPRPFLGNNVFKDYKSSFRTFILH